MTPASDLANARTHPLPPPPESVDCSRAWEEGVQPRGVKPGVDSLASALQQAVDLCAGRSEVACVREDDGALGVPREEEVARSARPGPYSVLITRPVTEDLEEVARAAGQGTLRVPIARTVGLTEAIAALTELERNGTPRGGKLLVTVE